MDRSRLVLAAGQRLAARASRRLGRVADKERNNDFSVSPLDFGEIHRVNNSNDKTVTIASTYNLGQGAVPLLQAGDPDAVLWLVRQGTGRVLLAAGDATSSSTCRVGRTGSPASSSS